MGLAGRENGGEAKNCRVLRRVLARVLARSKSWLEVLARVLARNIIGIFCVKVNRAIGLLIDNKNKLDRRDPAPVSYM